MALVPKHESITGANLSSSDGDLNRTYTLVNDNVQSAQLFFIIEGAILHQGFDFTIDTESKIVKFLNNVWDDQNISLDYFIEDSTSTDTYLSNTYSIVGSDLSGSTGEANRQFLFVTNKNIVSAQLQIIKSNLPLVIGVDYTFNVITKSIIFLTAVVDTENITINFMNIGNEYYATTKQVSQYSGTGIEILLEELGIGDSSNKSFDSENGNIIDDSYILYYGADGDNQLAILTEGIDYQISLDDGRIYLFASGLSSLSDNKLYLSYMSSPKQSNTTLNQYLKSSNDETDKLTGNYWGIVKSNTQYFDGYDSGYPQTDRPFGTQVDEEPEFELFYKSIQSVESVEFLDRTGAVTKEVDSTYVRFDDSGRVLIGHYTVPNGKRNVLIKFTHGYSETPNQIQELTALIAGMMALVNISGGSYKDVSTYTLGRKTFSIGQVYVNIESSIKQMKLRIESITNDMGPRYAIA